MRSLPHPGLDEADLYDRLRARRRPTTARVLTQARSTVLNAYATYTLETLYGLSTVISDHSVGKKLRSNYPVLRSGALSRDGAKILARSSVCCLCGLRATSELDHFLPKEFFPEFSALSLNLVPVCGVCNKRKGEFWREQADEPAFLHAYLDELPASDCFLRATLDITNAVVPSFQIHRTPGMSEPTFDLLCAQFEYLGLETAYAEDAIELLVEKLDAIAEYHAEGGPSLVRRYLDRDARSAQRPYGLNHWKPAVLRAAASSHEFCRGGFRLLGS